MLNAPLNAALAATVVRGLAAGGVRDVVLSPGSRNTPLTLACVAHPDLRCHSVLDERVAGFVALGLARAGGAPVALVATSGTAGAHYLPAVVEARARALPLVAITADRPPALHDCGAPQTVAQRGLFGAHTVHAREVGPADPADDPRHVATAVARALAAAARGPVHLNVAFRKPLAAPEVDPLPPAPPAPRVWAARPEPDPEAIALLRRLAETERGAIVVGPEPGLLGREAETAAAAAWLGRLLGWPVLADPTSGVRFGPHDQGAVVATYDALLRDPRFAAAHRPDVLVRLGRPSPSRPLEAWLRGAGRSVGLDPHGRWLDPLHTVGDLIAADPATVCQQVARRFGPRPRVSPWTLAWRRADRAAQTALATACGDRLWGGSVARAVVEGLAARPEPTWLHVGSSLAIRDVESFAPSGTPPLTITANRGANGIDGTLATAFGVGLAAGRPVHVLVGDLTFFHDLGALPTARALGVAATVVVVDNGGGAIFDHLPIAQHGDVFERWFVTPQTASVVDVARGCGADVLRIETAAALRRAVREGRREPGVTVIEAPVERARDLEQREAAWRAASSALASLGEPPDPEAVLPWPTWPAPVEVRS